MPDLEGRHHGTSRGAAWTSRGGVTEGLEGRHHGTSRGDAMGLFTVLQLCKAQLSIINQRKTVNGPMAPDLEFCAVPLKVLWHRPLRSEMQPPRGPGGANFETKSFKFR